MTWLSIEALKFVRSALIVGLAGEQSDEVSKDAQHQAWALVEELERLINMKEKEVGK